jgi:hypothetical protein
MPLSRYRLPSSRASSRPRSESQLWFHPEATPRSLSSLMECVSKKIVIATQQPYGATPRAARTRRLGSPWRSAGGVILGRPGAVARPRRAAHRGVPQSMHNADYGRGIGRSGRLAASVLGKEDRCE